MRYKLIILLLLLPFLMKAQIIKERDVIATGGSSTSSGNLQLDYTIAELSVIILSSSGLTLTQGFNQPQGFYVAIPEIKPDEGAYLFPNPFRDYINVILSVETTDLNILITDLLGRIMPGSNLKIPADPGGSFRIDCSSYPPGIYAVRIINNTTKEEECYKIIKTN